MADLKKGFPGILSALSPISAALSPASAATTSPTNRPVAENKEGREANDPETCEKADQKMMKLCLFMDSRPETYHVLVIEDTVLGQIVGCATLLVELKFLRGGRCMGHIEDVVVAKSHRGHHLGQRLVNALVAEARLRECYKVILDCSKENIPFYCKLGFAEHQHHLALYFDPVSGSPVLPSPL